MPFPTFAKYFLQLIAIFIVYAFPLFAQQTFSPFLTPDDFRYKIDSESFTFLTKLDFENARKYKELIEAKSRRNYILTQQRYYRGDIQGKAAWKRKGNSKTPTSRRYNGVSNSIKKWNNARIPYILGSDYTARERAVLARAFQEYQGRTCIRFVPKTENDQDFLYIGKIDGCYSDVGRAGGRQELSLDDGCLHLDTVIHELMHSIGFYHEHERWDRDNYLIILWENIDKEAVDQFGRVDLVESNYYGQKYDYRSIMHYDSLAFSRNGRETLVAREPEMTNVMGSATEFSQTDLAKIRGMYQCETFFFFSDSNTFIEEFTGEDNSLSTESVFQSPFAPKWLPFQFIYSRPFTVTAGTPIKQQPPIMFNFVERDKLPNCPFWIAYCNFLFYKSLLLELCPQTCFNANKNQRSELSYSNLNMRNSFPLFLKKKRRGEN